MLPCVVARFNSTSPQVVNCGQRFSVHGWFKSLASLRGFSSSFYPFSTNLPLSLPFSACISDWAVIASRALSCSIKWTSSTNKYSFFSFISCFFLDSSSGLWPLGCHSQNLRVLKRNGFKLSYSWGPKSLLCHSYRRSPRDLSVVFCKQFSHPDWGRGVHVLVAILAVTFLSCLSSMVHVHGLKDGNSEFESQMPLDAFPLSSPSLFSAIPLVRSIGLPSSHLLWAIWLGLPHLPMRLWLGGVQPRSNN